MLSLKSSSLTSFFIFAFFLKRKSDNTSAIKYKEHTQNFWNNKNKNI